jgi:hypothetical protein
MTTLRIIACLLFALTVCASVPAMAAAGDSVPRIDPKPSCRGVSRSDNAQTDLKNCLQEEQGARDQLVKDWGKFRAADRASCVQLSTMGGEPSYVELLTCLEMAAAAREGPPDMLAGSDLATPSRRRTRSPQ